MISLWFPSHAGYVVVEDVMLPYPWGTTGKMVVVMLEGQPWLLLQAFQSFALHDGGPMHITIDVLKARLKKVHAKTLKIDATSPPGVLEQCKTKGAVLPKGARAKLVAMDGMQEALLKHGCRPDHVASLFNMHRRMIDQAKALRLEEEQRK